MSKEEPAWKAELRSGLRQVIRGEINLHEFVDLAAGQIKAAEQRGREAGEAQFSAVNGAYNALALRTQSVRDKATAWAALAPPDDWGENPGDTQLADVGRYLLALLAPDPQ